MTPVHSRVLRSVVIPVVGAALLSNAVLSCGGVKQSYTPAEPHWVELDRRPVPDPEPRDPSLAWTSFDRSFIVQAEQFFDFDRLFRNIGGNPRQAYDVNTFDEVPNSAWFTNRQGMSQMSPEQIATADGNVVYPDTLGEWLLSRPKVGGATIGFWVKDANGKTFIIKFDPPGHPEMATAAEAMGARYFYACGYNVPHSVIVRWHPDQLRIKEGVTFKDGLGNEQPLTRHALDSILDRAERMPDGRFRSSASPLLPGEYMGPFSYTGRRKDDPNDWCPHEHRRELRALYIPASLVNHYDTKDHNSLDMFMAGDDGQGYVRHHLLDFGSTFGSDGQAPKHPRKGYANWFDPGDVFVNWITLGTKKWGWENFKESPYPSIGYFESEIFEPEKFDPVIPNPAFENMTDRDAYWGTKIVLAFEEEHIRALVDIGEFSNPDAAEYLVQRLLERREKIGRRWLYRVNPLELIRSAQDEFGLHIELEDLAVRYGFEEASGSDYRYRVLYRGKNTLDWQPTGQTEITLPPADLQSLSGLVPPDAADDSPSDWTFVVELQTRRGGGDWSKPVRLYYWFQEEPGTFLLVGIVHED